MDEGLRSSFATSPARAQSPGAMQKSSKVMQTHAHAKVMHTPPALMQLQHAGPLKGPSAPTMMSVPRMPQTEFGQAMMMDDGEHPLIKNGQLMQSVAATQKQTQRTDPKDTVQMMSVINDGNVGANVMMMDGDIEDDGDEPEQVSPEKLSFMGKLQKATGIKRKESSPNPESRRRSTLALSPDPSNLDSTGSPQQGTARTRRLSSAVDPIMMSMVRQNSIGEVINMDTDSFSQSRPASMRSMRQSPGSKQPKRGSPTSAGSVRFAAEGPEDAQLSPQQSPQQPPQQPRRMSPPTSPPAERPSPSGAAAGRSDSPARDDFRDSPAVGPPPQKKGFFGKMKGKLFG